MQSPPAVTVAGQLTAGMSLLWTFMCKIAWVSSVIFLAYVVGVLHPIIIYRSLSQIMRKCHWLLSPH